MRKTQLSALPFDILHIGIISNVKNSNGNACVYHKDTRSGSTVTQQKDKTKQLRILAWHKRP